jgi:hypothetical protein
MYASTLSYFDGTFVKIRTLTLGYDVKQNWIKKFGLTKLHVYVTAQNPLILFSAYHKLSGLDPETNSYGDANQAVASYNHRILTVGYNTPTTHNYLIGLNMSF